MPTLNQILDTIDYDTVQEYHATADKFVYVVDYLCSRDYYVSAHQANADEIVGMVEDRLDEMAFYSKDQYNHG